MREILQALACVIVPVALAAGWIGMSDAADRAVADPDHRLTHARTAGVMGFVLSFALFLGAAAIMENPATALACALPGGALLGLLAFLKFAKPR